MSSVWHYSLFVFADDGEDDDEHETDGDGDEQNQECWHPNR